MSPYWQQPMCIGLISLWIFHPGKSLNYSGCIKHSQRQYSKPFQTLPITIRPYAFWYLVQPLQSFCRNGYNANDCQDTRRQRCQSDVENVRSSQCFWRQNSVNLVFFLFFFFFLFVFWKLQGILSAPKRLCENLRPSSANSRGRLFCWKLLFCQQFRKDKSQFQFS